MNGKDSAPFQERLSSENRSISPPTSQFQATGWAPERRGGVPASVRTRGSRVRTQSRTGSRFSKSRSAKSEGAQAVHELGRTTARICRVLRIIRWPISAVSGPWPQVVATTPIPCPRLSPEARSWYSSGMEWWTRFSETLYAWAAAEPDDGEEHLHPWSRPSTLRFFAFGAITGALFGTLVLMVFGRVLDPLL